MAPARSQLDAQADSIELLMRHHRIRCRVGGALVTPRLIRFHLQTDIGVKISRIQALREEVALTLRVDGVRIFRERGHICIEIARGGARPIPLLSICKSLEDLPPFTTVLGLDASGLPLLLRIPSPDVVHVLVAGTTGSGKTALSRSILLTLALHNSSDLLRFVLIDPKGRGFGPLRRLPHAGGHLYSEPDKIDGQLDLLIHEMERRDRKGERLPLLIVAIDELADLVQSGGKKMEKQIGRLAQRGREAGIHLLSCTQKPTAALIGSAVKANFPVRIVGAVSGKDEARYASGVPDSGAESLAGRGDFLLVARGDLIRFQAGWLPPEELEQLIEQIRKREEGRV